MSDTTSILDTVTAFFIDMTLPALPPTEVLVACSLAAAMAALILAACFGPFLALAGEILSIRTKRGFYARAARQIAQMSLTLGILAAALAGGAMAWFTTQVPALLAPPYGIPLALTGGSIVAFLLMLAVFIKLRPTKGLAGKDHLAAGLAAGSFALFSLFCTTGVVRRLLHSPPEFDVTLPWATQLTLFFAIPSDSFFWPLLIESVPLGFALAASFATLWLVVIRDRQDYGRDYYAFAMPYCARWALGATPVAVLAGAFVFLESREIMLPELSHLPSPLLDAASAALPLLACILWIFVIRSAHPMRHKISVTLAFLFLMAGFAGQVLMLNKVIPSP